MPSPTQDHVLHEIRHSQGYGQTWREIDSLHGRYGHSEISAALTALHRKGTITKLAGSSRLNCSVYVLPEYVAGRPTEEYGAKRRAEWSPDHPCFEGRPILIGDQVQLSDPINDGRLTTGAVSSIKLYAGEATADLQIEELGGVLIGLGDILAHTPKRG